MLLLLRQWLYWLSESISLAYWRPKTQNEVTDADLRATSMNSICVRCLLFNIFLSRLKDSKNPDDLGICKASVQALVPGIVLVPGSIVMLYV